MSDRLIALGSACTPATPPPAPAPAPTQQPSVERLPVEALPVDVPPVVTDADRWRCTKDEDCTQTCALGAVSAAWIKAHPEADSCDDGCGWKWGKQACRDNECVTLDENGGIDPSCTKLTKPIND